MEDIKSNFDKIMAEFNNSVTHSAPKKLYFESLREEESNGSGLENKKRRYQNDDEHDSSVNSNACISGLNGSGTVPSSPWETRRMKADLIEAKTRISKLKLEIDKSHKVRMEMETLYESKVNELKKQCDFSTNKIQDLETHLQSVRKREHAAKTEKLQLEKQISQYKHEAEETIAKLERLQAETEDSARQMQIAMESEINEYQQQNDRFEMEIDVLTEDLEQTKAQLDEANERCVGYEELKGKFESRQQELDFANSRIKELEFQIASYNDWKDITEQSQPRLQNMAEMSKELELLQKKNKELYSLLGQNLFLEQQVNDLQASLKKEQCGRSEATALQVKLNHCEQELNEWLRVAQDHCPPNMIVSPLALRTRIEHLLQNDIILACEKGAKAIEAKSIESELRNYKEKCETYVKEIEELNSILKRYKSFREKVLKKLSLITRERDLYKQLVENFEKDLTISNPTEVSNQELQLRSRIDVLEKTLVGYQELCATVEKEPLASEKLLSTAALTEEGYAHYKNELDSLRAENERLRHRKEALELELEHRYIKGDFNISQYKVVHFKQNPAAEAYEKTQNLVEKLQAEIERLKRRNKSLEENGGDQTSRLNETNNMTMSIKELNSLRAELESANAKMRKTKEVYKKANVELRDICYELFGYRIDAEYRVNGDSTYRLFSRYAENPDDYLHFRLSESKGLVMVDTPFMATLRSFQTQLNLHHALPVFISSLTMELFQRGTMTLPAIGSTV